MAALPSVCSQLILPDREFEPGLIEAAKRQQPEAEDVTTTLNGWQVSGYILLPWAFLELEISAS